MYSGGGGFSVLGRAYAVSADPLPGLPSRGRRAGVGAIIGLFGFSVGLLVPPGAEQFATAAVLATASLGVGILSSWSP